VSTIEQPSNITITRALSLIDSGSLEEARVLLEHYLADEARTPNADISQSLRCQHLLGYVLSMMGEYESAKTMQVAHIETLKRTSGTSNDAGDAAFVGLGDTLSKLDEFDAAVGIWQVLIKSQETRLGEANERTLRSLSSLADVLRRSGDFYAARQVDGVALDRATNAGIDWRSILDIKRHLISDVLGLKEWSEASTLTEELYSDAIARLDDEDELRRHCQRYRRRFERLIDENRRGRVQRNGTLVRACLGIQTT
jgi:hypothetical protein